MFVVGFATGPGSIPWFFVNELFQQSARPMAASMAVVTNWTANFLVGLCFLPMQVSKAKKCKLSIEPLYFNYGGLTEIGFELLNLTMPV